MSIGVILLATFLGAWGPDGGRPARSVDPAIVLDHVDWALGQVDVTGFGPPDAESLNPSEARLGARIAARQQVIERLRGSVQALSVDGRSTVLEALLAQAPDGGALKRLPPVLGTFQTDDERFFSDDGLALHAHLPLGYVAALFSHLPAPAGGAGKAATKGRRRAGTGLILDTTGLAARPCLLPSVEALDGGVLYGGDERSGLLPPEALAAGFAPTVKAARGAGRVGKRPWVVRPVRVEDGCRMVLSDADAKKLSGAAYLPTGGVVIAGTP